MPTRTWTGATNNSWATNTNWAENVVPTNLDDVIFGTNVNCTVSSAAVCKTITFGTYSGTFTNTGGLTVSGNVSLGASVVWGTWSQYLTVNTNATLTSNGMSIPNLQFYNTITITLADDWTVTAFLAFQNATVTVTLNSNKINVSGGQILHRNGCTINGTTEINITGNVSWSAGSSYISNPITINTAGTFTLSNNFNLSSNVVTWLAGTMITTGSTAIINGNVTFTGTGLTFNNLTAITNTTLTLSNNITIVGNLNTNTSATSFVINGFTLYVGGGLDTIVNTTVSGTTNIVLNGTGTIQNTSASGNWRNNIEINTTGTITFGTNFRYNTGTFKWTAGTTDTTGSTVTMGANTTFDVNGAIDGNGSPISTTGVNFWNFTNSGAFTATLTTPICVCNTFNTANGSYTTNAVYAQGDVTVVNNTGTGTLVINGTGNISTNSILRLNTTINTNGKLSITTSNNADFFRFDTGTLTFIKGIFDTKNATLVCAATSTLIGIYKLRFKQVRAVGTLTMDGFFQGSASQICEVIANNSGTNWNIQFTDGFQHIGRFCSIQDMTLINTVASRGSLLLTYKNANKGRNVGNITYTNNKPNGIINYTDYSKSLESMAGVQLQGDPAYN